MNLTVTLETTFEVGHQAPYPETCRRQHGHLVHLAATLVGGPVAERGSFPAAYGSLADGLYAIRDELSLRNLNDLIAPANPTAPGLAFWAWERLVMSVPGLRAVEVRMGPEITARVER